MVKHPTILTYFTSIYMDIQNNAVGNIIPAKLKELIKHCASKRFKLIIGMDSAMHTVHSGELNLINGEN